MGIQSVMFVLQSLGLKGTVLCPEQIWKLLKSTKCHKVGRWHFESDSIGGQYWNWDAGVSGRGGLSRLCVCVFPACDDRSWSLLVLPSASSDLFLSPSSKFFTLVIVVFNSRLFIWLFKKKCISLLMFCIWWDIIVIVSFNWLLVFQCTDYIFLFLCISGNKKIWTF